MKANHMGFEGSSIRSKWPGLVRQHHSKSGSFPNSKRIEKGKLVQSAGAVSGRKLVLLQDWWLVKADSDSHGKQLGIGGFTLTKNQGIRCFSSAPIVKRHDAVTLQTVDSMTIMVHGYLNRSRTLENGFSQEVCDNFLIGFPYYWEDYTALSVNEEPKGASPSDAYKTPVEESRGPNMTCRSNFDDIPAEASSGKKETSMSMQSMDFVSEEPKGVSPSDACKTPAQEASEPDMNIYSFDDIAAKASSVKKDCSIDHRTAKVKKRRGRPSSGKKKTSMFVSEEPKGVSPSDACKTPAQEASEPDMDIYSFDDIAAKASSVKKDCSIDHRTARVKRRRGRPSKGKKKTSMSMQSMDFVSEEPKGVSPSDACKTPAQEAGEPDMNIYIFDNIAAKASMVKKDCSTDHRTSNILSGGPLTRSRARLVQK